MKSHLTNCLICNKEFKVYPYQTKNGFGKYCSRLCRTTASKGRPTWFSLHVKKGICLNTGKSHFKKGAIPHNKGLVGFLGGNKHYKWQAENPSYRAVHGWIAKQLGKPKTCEFCKTKEAKRYEWANKSGKYERNLSDWLRLCKRCHNIYDNIGKKGWATRRGQIL